MKYLWTAIVLALTLIPVATAIGTYPAVDPAMTLYMHFNNNSSAGENLTKIYDWSGNNNNGTTNVSNYNQSGGFLQDGAYNFNTSEAASIIVNDSPTLNLTNNFSISLWVYYNTSSSTAFILSKRSAANNRYELAISTSAQIFFSLGNGTTSSDTTSPTNALSRNAWHMITATFGNNQTNLYLDGGLVGTNTFNATVASGNTQLYIGSRAGIAGTFFNGSIDEVILYNRTLSNTEIQNLFIQYNGCFTPYNGVVYTQTFEITWCNGIYYFNVSSGGAAVTITGTNMTLNMNGSTLVGNWTNETTPTSYAIRISGNQNTIKNGIINSFFQGIQIDSYNQTNITNNTINKTRIALRIASTYNTSITSNTFYNTSYGSIYSSQPSYNTKIGYNIFSHHDRRAMTFETGGDLYDADIYNNRIVNYTGDIPAGTTSYINNYLRGNNITIRSNYAESSTTSDVYYSPGYDTAVFSMDSITNSSYINNSVRFSGYGMRCSNCTNILYAGNIINDSDEGLRVTNSRNLTVFNNYLTNITANYDGYDLGMDIRGTNTINIYNNTFTKVGQGAIYLNQVANVTIHNNVYSFVQANERSLYQYTDYFEPRYAIKISPFYKSYFGNGTSYQGNINLNSTNVTIYNETFLSQPDSFLWLEAAFNITNDFNNTKYYAWEYPDYLGRIEVYFNQYFDYMSGIDKNRTPRNFSMYGFNSVWKIEQHVLNDSMYLVNFKRDNNGNSWTVGGVNNLSYNVSMFNLSTSLIYNSTGYAQCTNIPSCSSNIVNYLLTVNDSLYHLRGYNITQGVIRSNDPVTLTAPTLKVRIITSGLVNSITNVTIIATGSPTPLSPILVHASNGVIENITSYFYDSVAGTFTFNATITPGANTLYVDSVTPPTPTPGTYTAPAACSAASSSISTFANWLTLLAIVLIVGIVLYVLYGVYSGSLVIDAGFIIKAGVGLIIAGIFIVIGVIIVAGAASTCV